MRINAHSIKPGDDVQFSFDGKLIEGMVTYAQRIGQNMMFELWHSLYGSSDFGLEITAEVELIGDTDRTYPDPAPAPAATPIEIRPQLAPEDEAGFDAW